MVDPDDNPDDDDDDEEEDEPQAIEEDQDEDEDAEALEQREELLVQFVNFISSVAPDHDSWSIEPHCSFVRICSKHIDLLTY